MNLFKKFAFLTLFVALFVSTPLVVMAESDAGALAADRCRQNEPCTKQARSNDSAQSYTLYPDGDLFRNFSRSNRCLIAEGVEDFKISIHPDDAAVAYFVDIDRDLYYVRGGRVRCQGATDRLLSDVKRYNVVPKTRNTVIVNTALTNGGLFQAWDNTKVVYTESGIKDYTLNSCFNQSGYSFSSYVAFLQRFDRRIVKVRINDGGWFITDNSTVDNRAYSNLGDFKNRNNVCNPQLR